MISAIRWDTAIPISPAFSPRSWANPCRRITTKKRFDKAVSLLKMGMQSKDIANLLKYKTLNSFSKAFSNHFGMSPSEYRDMLKSRKPRRIRVNFLRPPGSPSTTL